MTTIRCGGCYKRIEEGSYITALNEQWHTGCFTCTHCKKPFSDGKYSVYKNQPYCKKDFDFICPTCGRVISDTFVEADNAKYHSFCLKCSVCRKVAGSVHEVIKGKVFCSECAALEKKASTFYSAPLKNEGTCQGCGKEILLDPYSADGATWHKYCFTCGYCSGMAGSGWKKHQGKICCVKCQEYICGACDKVISDGFVTLDGKKLHTSCLVCAWCSSQVDSKSFMKVQDKPCCDRCLAKMRAAANP